MPLPSSGPLSLNDIQGEFGGTNPIGMNEYYAGGGLVPAGTTGTFGAVPSSGALSVQNFYGTSQLIPIYIEEVFSTWLYNGTSAPNTVTNNVGLSAEGGLIWIKSRNNAASHALYDTARGATKALRTNAPNAQSTEATGLTAFNSNGFALGGANTEANLSDYTYASWTFRKQPKFFDVVTYTGNGATSRSISHSLGSKPGCIFIKAINDSQTAWISVNRDSAGVESNRCLNSTLAAVFSPVTNNNQYCNLGNASTFNVTSNFDQYEPQDFVGRMSANQSGVNYVAYVFAHDAGGFGPTGTDNVISCGSFTTDGSGNAAITLGYEPQWILFKSTTLTDSWYIVDSMRGWPVTTASTKILRPNTSGAETTGTFGNPTATGFTLANGGANQGYIYIAIRRGPMKVPTTGTSVYTGSLAGPGTSISAGFVPDMAIAKTRDNTVGASSETYVGARLTGNSTALAMSNAYDQGGFGWQWDNRTTTFMQTSVGTPIINWLFARAPGFMDVVCYTGTGVARTVAHNLTVAPELWLVKRRTGGSGFADWQVGSTAIASTEKLILNLSDAKSTDAAVWNSTYPSATLISLGAPNNVNASGSPFIAYLFASVSGVSKVGTFTGTGATQVINCGFTGGTRFVFIKATSATGEWYVWDSTRGIVAGNDPRLALNNVSVEVTNTDWVDTAASGFELSNAGGNLANSSGVSYIFLAVA